jgi:hypothetical protein
MSKIVRHEFVGNWVFVVILCITGVLIPIALLYAYCSTVRVETEMDNPEEFIGLYRTGKLKARAGSSFSEAT